MSYLWLQTIDGIGGHAIDPANIPRDRIVAARDLLSAAIAADGAPVAVPEKSGVRLVATAERRRLVLSLLDARDDAPIATMAVAPRDRDGAKLWPLMQRLAAEQGSTIRFGRPREPWGIVLARAAVVRFSDVSDVEWLPLLEAELACAWLEMVDDR